MIEFLPRIAAIGFDAETSKILQRNLEKLGMKFELSTKIESATVSDKGVELQGVQGDKKVSYSGDLVLVSVGRKPFTPGLDLDKVGVKLGPSEAASRSRTTGRRASRASIPSATSSMVRCSPTRRMRKVPRSRNGSGQAGHVNYNVIPGVIYTAPEAASVGLTEEEAKEKGIAVKVGKFAFTANGRAIANDTTEGFCEIHCRREDRQGARRAYRCELRLRADRRNGAAHGIQRQFEDLARTIHAHPTMSEAVKEACARGRRADAERLVFSRWASRRQAARSLRIFLLPPNHLNQIAENNQVPMAVAP